MQPLKNVWVPRPSWFSMRPKVSGVTGILQSRLLSEVVSFPVPNFHSGGMITLSLYVKSGSGKMGIECIRLYVTKASK